MSNKKDYFLCNAGFNVASVLPDGSINRCFNRKNENLGNIFTGFQFFPDLVSCSAEFCDCPLYTFEKNLHALATGKLSLKDYPNKYSAMLHWHITFSCNLCCRYCIVQPGDPDLDLFLKKQKASAIDVDAVIKTLRKTGRKYFIAFIGGEPFLVPNIYELAEALTRDDHVIMFNTNFSVFEPERFFDRVVWYNVGDFHISLHVESMERLNLLEKWIEKILYMKEIGFDKYFITCVAHPDVLKNADYYFEKFKRHNISFKFIPMIDGGGATSSGLPYPESYTEKELALMQKDWLHDYFPVKHGNQEEVIMSDYREPTLNPLKRGAMNEVKSKK